MGTVLDIVGRPIALGCNVVPLIEKRVEGLEHERLFSSAVVFIMWSSIFECSGRDAFQCRVVDVALSAGGVNGLPPDLRSAGRRDLVGQRAFSKPVGLQQ